jgi:uncharacterized membrane protein YgcG
VTEHVIIAANPDTSHANARKAVVVEDVEAAEAEAMEVVVAEAETVVSTYNYNSNRYRFVKLSIVYIGCYNCGEEGHMSRDCTKERSGGGGYGGRDGGGGGGGRDGGGGGNSEFFLINLL